MSFMKHLKIRKLKILEFFQNASLSYVNKNKQKLGFVIKPNSAKKIVL